MKDVLKRRAGVRREPEGRYACVARDPRGSQNESTGEVHIGQFRDGADVAARDDQHMKWGRLWLRVERDEVIVLETDRRRCFVRRDPAKDAVGS